MVPLPDSIICIKVNGLPKSGGPYTEPIATTYYMLMDMGNILLF